MTTVSPIPTSPEPTPPTSPQTQNPESSSPLSPTTPNNQQNQQQQKRLKQQRNRKNQQYKKKLDVGTGPHPLQTLWTFWYCKKQSKQSNFETTLVSLGTCGTVEEFWGYYSRLKRPHELTSNSNLHLFRGATRPMWESFPMGGSWVLRMRKGCVLLDRMWEELLIACIGENFEEPDVLGVVLRIRPKEDALCVWNANQHLKYIICEKLKTIMHLPANCPMEYRTNRFNMERRLIPGQKGADGTEDQDQRGGGGGTPGHGTTPRSTTGVNDDGKEITEFGNELLPPTSEKIGNSGKVEEK